jgi:hypothetical protein
VDSGTKPRIAAPPSPQCPRAAGPPAGRSPLFPSSPECQVCAARLTGRRMREVRGARPQYREAIPGSEMPGEKGVIRRSARSVALRAAGPPCPAALPILKQEFQRARHRQKARTAPTSFQPFGPCSPESISEGCDGDVTASRAAKRSRRCGGVNSARAPRRAIARQRTRAHAKARRERWRHVVERGAAVAADFLRRILHAEPVTARRTFRSQTLHCPSGQILHP